jgi:hypothetical protein
MLAMGIVLYVVNLSKKYLLLLKCICRIAAHMDSYQRLKNFIHRRCLIRIWTFDTPDYKSCLFLD